MPCRVPQSKSVRCTIFLELPLAGWLRGFGLCFLTDIARPSNKLVCFLLVRWHVDFCLGARGGDRGISKYWFKTRWPVEIVSSSLSYTARRRSSLETHFLRVLAVIACNFSILMSARSLSSNANTSCRCWRYHASRSQFLASVASLYRFGRSWSMWFLVVQIGSKRTSHNPLSSVTIRLSGCFSPYSSIAGIHSFAKKPRSNLVMPILDWAWNTGSNSVGKSTSLVSISWWEMMDWTILLTIPMILSGILPVRKCRSNSAIWVTLVSRISL